MSLFELIKQNIFLLKLILKQTPAFFTVSLQNPDINAYKVLL